MLPDSTVKANFWRNLSTINATFNVGHRREKLMATTKMSMRGTMTSLIRKIWSCVCVWMFLNFS